MEEKNEMVFFQSKEDGYIEAVTKSGKTVMRFDQRENLVELNSETGEIRLNGYDLPRLDAVDIHMHGYDAVKMTVDLDVRPEKILLLIEGKVKWFEGIDREKYLHGQEN